MPTYYADFDLGTGNNDGSDAANAWQTMADVIAGSNNGSPDAPPVAGDTILCKGTDSISSTVAVTISGSQASGYIRFIGVDSSWSNVGGSTRAVVDAQNNAISVLTLTACNFVWFENFEFKNAGSSGSTYHGITYSGGSDFNVFLNVITHNNYGNGVNANQYLDRCTFIKCRAHSNSLHGFYRIRGGFLGFCRADNNSQRGIDGIRDAVYFGCITHDNGVDGIRAYADTAVQCVSYSNTNIGIEIANFSYKAPVFIGMRAASNGTGFDIDSAARALMFYCYGDNTTEIGENYDDVHNDGTSTLTINGTDTDEGFSDTSTDDYSLASDATYRREAVDIP